MSANEETPDLPKVTGSGFDLLHDGSNIVDTQMTFSLTSVEEDNIEDLPETPQSEEMSSFQSARERNERLNAARNTTTPGGQRNGGWRLDNPPTSSGFTPPFGSYPPPPNAFAGAPGMADVYNTPHLLDRTYISGEASVPLSAIAPGPVYPTETQLGLAYGYGIRRDDGSYTRLIRADELEELDTIPKFQGPEGLIILPPTRQLSPRRRQGPDAMISGDVVQSLPLNRPRRPGPNSPLNPTDTTQMQIDSIIQRHAATAPAVTPVRPQRREKIYCDKWIHEGVCAFTQMGCKYLHEMPMDKATQISLGLNHGIPTWYRRSQIVELRLSPPVNLSPPASSNPNRLSGPWRRQEASSGGDNMLSEPLAHPLSFGPIGPPGQPMSSFSNNPYSMLQSDSSNGDDEEDTITWTGRRR